PPRSNLFPYPTLFRSRIAARDQGEGVGSVRRDRRAPAWRHIDDAWFGLTRREQDPDRRRSRVARALLDMPDHAGRRAAIDRASQDRKSTRLNSSHLGI